MVVSSRRVFLMGLSLMILTRLVPEKLVLGQETESITIRWRVPREQVKTVKEDLNFDGEITSDESTIEDSKGLPLIYIIAGAVAVSQLARTLLEVYRDVRYGGLVIHNKDGEVLIDNDPRFSSGTLIIIQGEDVKVFQDKNQPQTTELIDALKPLMKK